MISFLLAATLVTAPTTAEYIQHLKPKIEQNVVNQIVEAVDKHCSCLDKKIVIALMMQESGLDPNEYNKDSVKGLDLGLMQLNTYWQRKRIHQHALNMWEVWTIDKNVMLGCEYLQELEENISNKFKFKWAFYHSKTYEKRIIYINLVSKYIRKLERFEKEWFQSNAKLEAVLKKPQGM